MNTGLDKMFDQDAVGAIVKNATRKTWILMLADALDELDRSSDAKYTRAVGHLINCARIVVREYGE